MTEQEFIATLAPLTEDITGTAISKEQLDVTFVDLEIDSLNQVEIISHVEDKFNCQIDDSTLRTIRTPRELMEHIAKVTTAA
ncbi:phosphopantetheine-binding protein [Streptomyces sp. NPDC019443]|uniref:phosphopantetheine-binding protein n=1 Tax=Streptomyces sp. NPDC019443 TaxID=3365061 RepID=UPI00378C0658